MSWNNRHNKYLRTQGFDYVFSNCAQCTKNPVQIALVEVLWNSEGCQNVKGSFRDKLDFIAEKKHNRFHKRS